MITIHNYFKEIKKIDLSSLPAAIGKGHEFVEKVTAGGSNWESYHSSDAIKKTIDIYLEKLNELIKPNKKVAAASNNEQPFFREIDILTPDIIRRSVKPEKKVRATTSGSRHSEKSHVTMVERVPEELRFIRRFVNLDGKVKTKDEILRFINSLQKAILEKRIRKSSSYADQVKIVQTKLLDLYHSMKAKIKIELKPDTVDKLKALAGKEKVLASVNFIKNYISLNGKPGMKKKADGLLKRITRAMDKKLIPSTDPYMHELVKIRKNLETFLDQPSMKVLAIEKNELNGLEGILGCACQSLDGFEGKPAVMNSMDFANMRFATIGLKGKWYKLIGDPSSNFTAMVFGKPKMGKSYLCIDFAGYLARHHGKVLYVAKEEGLDYTLQQKLNDKDVAHPNLFVASVMPDDLQQYDFIFLDSVNKLGLEPQDLNRLKQTYPAKSFVFIFQSTKEGKFRGANTFQHDVDIVIEVPEQGKAVQMGRFNQGGEIDIFEEQYVEHI